MKNDVYRLRPSVSFVPIDKEKGRYDFFLSNTRKTVPFLISNDFLIDLILMLDGQKSLHELIVSLNIKENADTEESVIEFCKHLSLKCIIENVTVSRLIEQNKFRRILNFIADYIPSEFLMASWENICKATVAIVGLGAMGSWVASLLAQAGIQRFLLIDNDKVHKSNLNRSLFYIQDEQQLKTSVLAKTLKDINSSIEVFEENILLTDEDDLYTLARQFLINCENPLVINCADYPNVDFTSRIINNVCVSHNIPFIISGGYNLHLSLLGPTVIPHKTACFNCMKITLEELNNLEFKKIIKLDRPRRNLGSIVPLTAVSSSFVLNEAIRILLKSPFIEPSMVNRRGEFNFFTNTINYIELPKRDDCELCGKKTTNNSIK